MLIRSSLLWLTCDQVFLFDVQRSTSDYSMKEYKHAYCSGQSHSASSNVQSQPSVSIARAFPASVHARTPRVLHFINPRRACTARVTVVGSVCVCGCVCVCVCLLSQISPLEHLFVLKILSRTQRATEVKKFVGFSLKLLCSKVMASFAYP